MDTRMKTRAEDKFVTVDGLKIRYIEAGTGPAVLFLHGASLGSSADVFQRNLPPFAEAGFRAIAFDFPGYGRSEVGADLSLGFQRDSLPKFMDALGIKQAALMAHSRSGNFAVQLGLKDPARISHIAILGTGTMLPPLEGDVEGRYAGVQQRVDREIAQTEPTLAETKKLMQADLFHTELVTDDELALRHSHSIGKNFQIFVERAKGEGTVAAPSATPQKPLWQRLGELKMPLMLIFGRNDRARAGERAEMFKKMEPTLNLHIVEDCKHMVPWDVFDQLNQLAIPFLKGR
jgi:pimeloyl-ACP methyl ester carboxylesterase